MRNILTLLFVLLLSSCGMTYQLSTLNYDPIYEDENYIVVGDGVKVDTLNEFQFRNKLRYDFNFRYDFAQYALSQPISFDWNNRLLGNRYSWNSPYYGYQWNRTQMWHDWVWGFTPNRWLPFGYDRWGYNNWMGNTHWGYRYGWNNYYGWNGWYNNNWGWRQQMNSYAWQHRNRPNTVNVNGRRGSISNEVIINRRVNTNKPRTIKNNNDVVINKEIIKLRRNNPNIRIINNPSNNNIKPRGYSRPELNNNNRNNNNTIPVIRNNSRPNTNTRSNNNVTPTRVTPQRSSGGPVRIKRNQ